MCLSSSSWEKLLCRLEQWKRCKKTCQVEEEQFASPSSHVLNCFAPEKRWEGRGRWGVSFSSFISVFLTALRTVILRNLQWHSFLCRLFLFPWVLQEQEAKDRDERRWELSDEFPSVFSLDLRLFVWVNSGHPHQDFSWKVQTSKKPTERREDGAPDFSTVCCLIKIKGCEECWKV